MDLNLILLDFKHDPDLLENSIYQTLAKLVQYSMQVPHPAQGETLKRWQILSQVAQTNLSLAKLYESHLDALSILNELKAELSDAQNSALWAVWAAEGGPRPLQLKPLDAKAQPTADHSRSMASKADQHLDQLFGIKPWCSASKHVEYALMTYRDQLHQSQLLIIDLNQPAIKHIDDQWQAVGMQHTQTNQLECDGALVKRLAEPDAYLNRQGFWQGAAGVAACWFGATLAIAEYLKQACKVKPHSFKNMYLGSISTDIVATGALFRELAQRIDQAPDQSHEFRVRALRAQVEQTARKVLTEVGQALGATPFCQSAHFAQLCADLAVFIRQSHAAFDLENMGVLAVNEESVWAL